jgi:membrane protease YdiL (CAAX protease family)
VATVVLFVLASVAAILAASILTGMELDQLLSGQQLMGGSPAGFLVLAILPQLALLVVPIIHALSAREKLADSLQLHLDTRKLRLSFGAALATPAIGIWASFALTGLGLQSESITEIDRAIRGHSIGVFCIPVLIAVALVPGCCEELFFRGFLQQLFQRATPSWLALPLASLLFAIFHADLVHAMGVFPLGLWLGFLTHRSGSLLPAIAGHTSNNSLGVAATLLTTPSARTPELADSLEPTGLMIPFLLLGTATAIYIATHVAKNGEAR